MRPHRPFRRRPAATAVAAALVLPTLVVAGHGSVAASAASPAVPPSGVLAPPSPATASASSVVGLTLGEQGPAVVQVQEALIAAGIPVFGGADGHFGQMTAAALRKFQDQNGLAVTGAVDRETAVALGLIAERAISSGARPLSQVTPRELVGLSLGIVGPRVAELQRGLIDAGIPSVGGTDGVFGPMTKAAVVAYQAGIGVEPTGVVDLETASALVRGTRPHLEVPARETPRAEAPAPAAEPPAAATPAAERPADAPGARLIGLAIGARGPAVAEMQQAMLDTGMRFAGGADGIFGMITQNALRQFQHRHGLEVTGQVDAATAAALASPTAPAPDAGPRPDLAALAGLAPGAIGEPVRALQQALLDTGLRFPGGADGIFGPVTARALKEYQRTRGLEATGRVNEATARALAEGAPATVAPQPAPSGGGTPSATPVGHPSFGERGDRVRAMQQALIDRGITVPGGADGVFGAQTAGAIMTFQRAEGLAVTGVIDDTVASRLGLSAAPAPAPPSAEGVTLAHFPIQGRCHFGDTWHAPRGGGRLHLGVDIIAPVGNLIYAVADGTITQVYTDRPGSLTGNGLRLTMPDRTYFFYAHLDTIAPGIEVGTQVRAGQILGTNGATGNAGVPHLHFEVHPRGNGAVNPYPLVRAIDACSVTTPAPQP